MMRIFFILVLCLCSVVAALFAITAFSMAESAVHEIEALISVLIITVAAGAGLVAASVKRG